MLLTRGERPVFRDVAWRVRPGQRWLLVGPNGAGKTQLLKLLAGDVWPTPSGHESRIYRWRGREWDEPYGVKEEIAYVGAERQDKYERYGWDFSVTDVIGTGIHRTDIPLYPLTAAHKRGIARLLRQFDLTSLAARDFLTLSYGQRRLTLLARALASRPALLLLDELFEGLDREKHERVSAWLESTARSGMPWVLATHRSRDMPRVATHIAMLEGGRMKYAGTRSRAPRLGALQRASRRTEPKPRAARAAARGALLVRLARANVYLKGSRVVRDISMEVRAGDCWVVHGPNGSGKTTLLRMIYGDHGVDTAAIKRFGIVPGVPLGRFKRRVGWVAPNLQSSHPQQLTVAEVVQSGRYASIGLNDPPTAPDRVAARRALRFFGLAHLEARMLRELSYGQMRRVLFARAWVLRPRLLLLDEPFAGVDATTRLALRADVERTLAQGVGVIMTTHHDDEWPRGVTHELQLEEGRAIYCGPVRRGISRE